MTKDSEGNTMRRSKFYRGTFLSVAILAATSLAAPLVSRATKASIPKPPNASTGGTSQLSYSSAMLNATVNPHGSETTYYFQYGPTTAYGAQTTTASVGTGASGVRVSQAISGLQVGSAYHYRVVAISSVGTTPGQDRLFTTKSVPLKFELPKTPRMALFGAAMSITGSLAGTGAANHEVVLQASQFPFLGGFANIGSAQATNASGQFAFQITGLSQNTHLRVATLDTRPIYSPTVNVNVAVRVTLHARATRRKGYVKLYGTVSPSVPGASVAFQLLRPGRGPLTVSGTTTKKSSAGAASFSATTFIPHGRGGMYRAFVKAPDGGHAPGYSRAVSLRAAPAPTKAHHHK
jgi:hypothetical protein